MSWEVIWEDAQTGQQFYVRNGEKHFILDDGSVKSETDIHMQELEDYDNALRNEIRWNHEQQVKENRRNMELDRNLHNELNRIQSEMENDDDDDFEDYLIWKREQMSIEEGIEDDNDRFNNRHGLY